MLGATITVASDQAPPLPPSSVDMLHLPSPLLSLHPHITVPGLPTRILTPAIIKIRLLSLSLSLSLSISLYLLSLFTFSLYLLSLSLSLCIFSISLSLSLSLSYLRPLSLHSFPTLSNYQIYIQLST